MRRLTRGVVSTLADARDALRSKVEARRTPSVALDNVRRRLELLLAGLYGRPIAIDTKGAPKREDWVDALFSPAPKHMRGAQSLATTDGNKIMLPDEISDALGTESAWQRYRFLAIEQAERIMRATPTLASEIETPLVRDLFLLAESSVIDASVARLVRDGATQVRAERERALGARTKLRELSPIEQEVEHLVRTTLTSHVDTPLEGLRDDASPQESLAWAEARAKEITEHHDVRRYRGMAAVSYWESSSYVHGQFRIVKDPWGIQKPGAWNIATGGAREALANETSKLRGVTDKAPDDGDERISDERGVETKGADADGGAGAEEHAEKEGTGVAVLDENASTATTVGDQSPGVLYDEWDADRRDYRGKAVRVRLVEAEISEDGWAADSLEQHAPIVRSIRRRFERLRAQRVRLHAQRQGDDLDLVACVDALVDRATGHSASDRLYLDVRPARRGMAITVLGDVSGSTKATVTDSERIIDFEKLAMLLASEAFDALGDPYSLLTFSSHGANDVQLRTLKAFGDRNGRLVRERIGAIEPSGNTRLGAAIRHATAQLTRQPAGHRLLILLSDGKPSDQDRYMGSYAVEDSRQAIAEARAAGVFPFCLTVDREEPEYMAHMFGRAGYVMLMQPDQLPNALLKAVRHLIGAS
ncbi:MAG: VWA domain-containing protein [bacterium]